MDLGGLSKEEAKLLRNKHRREGMKAEIFRNQKLFMLEINV